MLRIVLVAALLTGCGDDGGPPAADAGAGADAAPEADADTSSLDTLFTTPRAGAIYVELDTTVSVAFDDNVDPASLTGSSFVVRDTSGADVPGTVVAGSSSVTFTPTMPLARYVTYTAQLTTAATDTSGNPLAGELTWSFTTRPLRPGDASILDTNDRDVVGLPQLAGNDAGQAIAVWIQGAVAFADGDVLASRYEPGVGWSSPALLETGSQRAQTPQVAMDEAGNAVVVWVQDDGVANSIWANYYAAGSGWGTAERIEIRDSGDATAPSVAMDSSGRAIAIWSQSSGTRTNLRANQYLPGSGWGTDERIEDETGDVATPQIAMNSAGNAVAVWVQHDGVTDSVWAARYTVGTGWNSGIRIEADDASADESPKVAIDPNGNALVVWFRASGGSQLWANRFDATDGWGTAAALATGVGDAIRIKIAMDDSGNGFAVWDKGTDLGVSVRRFASATATWLPTLQVDSGYAAAPSVAVDPAGNAILMWHQHGPGLRGIWAQRYSVDTDTWEPRLRVDAAVDAIQRVLPFVVLSADGSGVAIWMEDDFSSDRNLWANTLE